VGKDFGHPLFVCGFREAREFWSWAYLPALQQARQPRMSGRATLVVTADRTNRIFEITMHDRDRNLNVLFNNIG